MAAWRCCWRAPAFHPQLRGAELGPMVYATRRGTGQRKLLLIANMDTVYPRGTGARQPFRLDGNRAYGLGIADAKGGVALILHTVELLQRLGVEDHAQLGALINGDEEVGSPGSGPFLTQLGSDYDAVLSFEAGGWTCCRRPPAVAPTPPLPACGPRAAWWRASACVATGPTPVTTNSSPSTRSHRAWPSPCGW